MLFLIIVSHLPVLYTLFYHNLTGMPTANKGRIDLSKVSIDHKIVLDGQWEFYWNRLIVTEPQQDTKPDFLIRVNDYWSRYQREGTYLPAAGYASYRLVIKGFDTSRPMTAYIPDFGSAYRVFIDNNLVAQSGHVSKDKSQIQTTPRAELYSIMISKAEEHELVIEVATTRFAGLYMAPVLEDYASAIRGDNNRNNLRLILFGTALFSFIVLIFIYVLSCWEKRYSIWMPVMALFVLMRIMLTTEFFSFWQDTVFCRLSYEAINPLMFLISFVFKYLLIFLVQELLGIAFSRKEKVGFLVYYTVLFLVYRLVPYGFYNRYMTVLVPVLTYVLEVYLFLKIYSNQLKIKKYGLIIYCGTVLAIAGLSIDSYYINGNIYLNLSMALLTLLSVYLMILSLVSAMRIRDMYHELAVVSSNLSKARTQIDIQKEYYDELSMQINEVRSIRHDIHHFVGVLKRLSDEGRYEELSRFLSEYAEKADMEPHPVFCENIVANSILGYYSLRLRKLGIEFRCSGSIPKQLWVSDSDLCIILGNALDNAIEACEKLSPLKERFIAVEVRNINGQLLVRIQNSFNGILKIHDNKYLSAKDSPYHGFGLGNIHKIADNYGGFVKIEHNTTVFTLMAALPNHQGMEMNDKE
jgi:hypothetical protein